MLQAMIVEDNAIYRFAVKSIIRWEDYGFELVAEALNGRHAMELLQQQRVDLILTDINMPEMNGIDFIKEVKRMDPSIQMVALSSFDDFQFVKEALKLGAEDYLLKHELEPEALQRLLEQMHTRVIEERSKKQQAGYYQSSMAAMMPMLAKKLLLGEITNSQELNEQAVIVQLPFFNKPMVVITTVKTSMSIEDDTQHTQWKFLIEASLSNLDSETMSYMVIPVSEAKTVVIVYFLNEKRETAIRSDAYQAAYRILSAHQRSDAVVSLGLSSVGYNIKELQTLYTQSEDAIAHTIYEGAGKVYRYDTLPRTADMNLVSDSMISRLAGVMKTGQLAEVEKHTEQLFQYLKEHQPHIPELRQCMVDIFALLKFMATEKNVLQAEMKHWHTDLLKAIDALQPIQQIKQMFLETCRQMLGSPIEKPASRKEIQMVKDYIHAHYAEDITVVTLSHVLCLSANYLSNLFKQETGLRIVEYINRYRIEMALKLFRDPTLKVYEVAERTGFQDTSYFCKVFKEIEGTTVKHYKRQVAQH